jgi:hypothetical protein
LSEIPIVVVAGSPSVDSRWLAIEFHRNTASNPVITPIIAPAAAARQVSTSTT